MDLVHRASNNNATFSFICSPCIDQPLSLFRVLAPGGLAFIQVPIKGSVTLEDLSVTDPARRTELFGQADHLRLYGSDIRQRLEPVGFVVEEGIMPDLLGISPEQQTRFNCAKQEMVHLCRR